MSATAWAASSCNVGETWVLLNHITSLAVAARGLTPTSAVSLPTGTVPSGVSYIVAEKITDAAGSYAVFAAQPVDASVPASLGLLQPATTGSAVAGTLWLTNADGTIAAPAMPFAFSSPTLNITDACATLIDESTQIYEATATDGCYKLPTPGAQAGCLLGVGIGLGIGTAAGCLLSSPAPPSARFMSWSGGTSFYTFVEHAPPGGMFANNIVYLNAGPYCVHYPIVNAGDDSSQCYSMNFDTQKFVPTTVSWHVETKWPDGVYSLITYTSNSPTNTGSSVGVARYNLPLPYGTYAVNVVLTQMDLCPQGQYFPSACTGPSHVDKVAAQLVYES